MIKRRLNKFKLIFYHCRNEGGENCDSEEEGEDTSEFPGRKEIVTFLYWLTFCDKVKALYIFFI